MKRLQVPVLSLGFAMAQAGPGSLPIWVGALVAQHMISTQGAGLLATGELALTGLATLATSALGPRLNPRRAILASALIFTLANIIAMGPNIEWIVVGRLLSGLCMGPICAIVTVLGARGEDGQRRLSIMQGSALVLISVLFLVSPYLISAFGVAGMFGATALTGAILAASAGFALPDKMPQRERTVHNNAGGMVTAAVLASAGYAIITLGLCAFTAFIFVIGVHNGLTTQLLSKIAAFATPFGIVGAVMAHRLGERWGLLRPNQVGLLVLAAGYIWMVRAGTVLTFGVGSILICLALSFTTSYCIAIISRNDTSGRITGASSAVAMGANALGPVFGGAMIGAFGAHGLGAFSAGCTIVAVALFTVSAFLGREKPGIGHAPA